MCFQDGAYLCLLAPSNLSLTSILLNPSLSNYIPLLLLPPYLTSLPLTDGEQMIIWTGKVEVTPQLKSHLIKWASQGPSSHTGVFLGGGLTGHHAKYLRPTRFEMPNYVCRSFHDDVRGGSYCRGLTKCRIFSGNRIRLNQNESQAYLLRTFRQHEYWWEWVLNRVQSNC